MDERLLEVWLALLILCRQYPELIPCPTRIGTNANGQHRRAYHRLLSPCKEIDRLGGKGRDRPVTSKRRHSTSNHKSIARDSKRFKRQDRRPLCPPNSAPTSSASSTSNIVSIVSLHSRADLGRHRDAQRERYEKRPRCKTKADKYDLRIGSNFPKLNAADTAKKTSSKRHRRKSGHALNSDFQAPNVAQHRLTLKASGGPGMFHRGKASSPLHRRGLPDLTFSEMNFLSRQQDHNEVQHPHPKEGKLSRSTKKTNKEKFLTQQISEYFQRPTAAPSSLPPGHEITKPGKSTIRMPPTSSVQSSPGKKSFEGYRRARPHHALRSHPAPRKDIDIFVAKNHVVPSDEMPESEHCEVHSTSTSDPQHPESPTSHYSWSVTPSQAARRPKQFVRNLIDDTDQPSFGPGNQFDGRRSQSDNERSKATCREQLADQESEESYVSELSLEQYTRSILLGLKQDWWHGSPGRHIAAELYTLADLKYLARLERLDATKEETRGLQNDIGSQVLSSHSNISNPNLGHSDAHPLYLPAFRDESFRIPDFRGNMGQHLWMRQTSPPEVKGLMGHHLNQQDIIPDRWTDTSRLRHLGFEAGSYGDRGFPQQSPRRPSLTQRGSEIPIQDFSPTLLRQSALEERLRNDLSRPRIRCQSTPVPIHQVIHDIQEEELLMSRDPNFRRRPAIDVEVTAAAVESCSNQWDWPGDLAAHNLMHDHDALLSQEPPVVLAQGVDRAIYDDVVDRNPETSSHQPYSPKDSKTFDRIENHHHPGKGRSENDPPNQSHSSIVHCTMDGIEQRKEQDDDCSLSGFWRPNLLY